MRQSRSLHREGLGLGDINLRLTPRSKVVPPFKIYNPRTAYAGLLPRYCLYLDLSIPLGIQSSRVAPASPATARFHLYIPLQIRQPTWRICLLLFPRIILVVEAFPFHKIPSRSTRVHFPSSVSTSYIFLRIHRDRLACVNVTEAFRGEKDGDDLKQQPENHGTRQWQGSTRIKGAPKLSYRHPHTRKGGGLEPIRHMALPCWGPERAMEPGLAWPWHGSTQLPRFCLGYGIYLQ